MRVGIGYSDNPDSGAAGIEAAQRALTDAQRAEACDFVLLFCTARHNQQALREAVVSITGNATRIYGGGAVGIITNEEFGYAGDQVGVACFWLDDMRIDAVVDGGLVAGEEETGERIGRELARLGVEPDSPVMLFYDAVDRSGGDMRLLMATWLLAGLEKGLGFLPDITGAGMQGDHICSPTSQYTGDGLTSGNAIALAFSKDIRIDSAIMHGCRPASQYFTVTKADGPVILEIDGKPALAFMDELLDSAIAPEDYPFFLLFGINHGDRWGEFDENNYASRLCLDIDKERGGIVMFEPDMVEGTQFQLMIRSMEFDYMKPKIEAMFDQLDDREPVLAMYIDCAGRCAGYGGMELEDAIVVQDTVRKRVPLLGLYTGVEIASIGGRPRGLDWTGVFCLFSKAKEGAKHDDAARAHAPLWESRNNLDAPEDIPLDALIRLNEQNAAKVLALDTQSIAIRHELEQKRRGFSLLAELSVSLRQPGHYDGAFVSAAQRINAALNMQKTMVLVPTQEKGCFTPSVLQGYSMEEKAELAGRIIRVDTTLLDPQTPVLITAADPPERLAAFREAIMLPYFIASPVILQNQIAAILITGRMMEAPPFLSRLGRSDSETVQAISTLLASVIVHQRLDEAENRARIMLDAMPLCCIFWDEEGNQIDCNEEALRLFGLTSKGEFLQRFYRLAPEFQPDGRPSEETARALVLNAFISGSAHFEWVYMTMDGELIPSEVTLVRVPSGENYNVAGYIRDLREQKAAMAEISRARDLAEQNVRAKSEFMASVSHEVRTPLNAVLAMARAASRLEADDSAKTLIEQGTIAARVLASAIDSILDFSRMEAGQVTLDAKPFNVRDITEGVLGMLSQEAEAKSIALRAEAGPDLPEQVIGDATRLQQAVLNIAANAVKFTEEGEVVLRTFRRDSADPSHAQIVFEVKDTGIGISEEQYERLFEPLTAADSSYVRKRGGLGMGLAISRSLVRLMGGEITGTSRPGEGSTFTISVPLALPERADANPEDTSPASAYEELSGMRVLVAEDNPINQIIVEELLTAAGISVVTADNGLEVLEALDHAPFDVVLMDIQMPKMDGLTATAKIRADHRYDTMPILAMTANSTAEHREESLRTGMNDHLTKPINVEELYAALKRWGKKQPSDERTKAESR